jgi:glycerophosphoryl diester phosphodiesterase
MASSAGSSRVLASYAFARLKLTQSLANSVLRIQAFQIPTQKYGIDFTHPRFIEAVLNQDKEIHYWTINDAKQMVDLFNLGAHGIVTDRADLAIKVFS